MIIFFFPIWILGAILLGKLGAEFVKKHPIIFATSFITVPLLLWAVAFFLQFVYNILDAAMNYLDALK